MQAFEEIFRKIFRVDNTRRVELTYYVYHSTAVLGLLCCLRFRLESARCDCTSSENPTSLFHHTIAAVVWLSDEHYFEKKIARLRTAAARPPYEIMKPLGSYIAVDQFFWQVYFWVKKQPQGRPTTISHVDILGGPVNWLILPCEGRAAATR